MSFLWDVKKDTGIGFRDPRKESVDVGNNLLRTFVRRVVLT